MHTLTTISHTFRYGIDKSLRACANSVQGGCRFSVTWVADAWSQNKKRFSAHSSVQENLYLRGLLTSHNERQKRISYHLRNGFINDSRIYGSSFSFYHTVNRQTVPDESGNRHRSEKLTFVLFETLIQKLLK